MPKELRTSWILAARGAVVKCLLFQTQTEHGRGSGLTPCGANPKGQWDVEASPERGIDTGRRKACPDPDGFFAELRAGAYNRSVAKGRFRSSYRRSRFILDDLRRAVTLRPRGRRVFSGSPSWEAPFFDSPLGS